MAQASSDLSALSAQQPTGLMETLRNELASQIELEALRFSDPDKRAVLPLALKHFDAGEP